MQRQSATIHYRRLEDVTGAMKGLTLESAVRKAMSMSLDGGKIAEHWKRRAWVSTEGGADTLLMNIYEDGGDFYFGDLTQYTTGYMQALLASEEDVAMLSVEQTPPPPGREYVHSMMYWFLKGNHVLVLQSRSLTGKNLEEYFSWLLKDRTPTVGPLLQVILQSKFDTSEAGGDIDDIREIVVGGRATESAAAHALDELVAGIGGPESEEEFYREVEKRRSWRDRALNVLRAVMNNEADVQKFLSSIPDDADLEVSVHIGYKARRRRVSRAPMQQALRNLPDGDITAIGKNGRMSRGDIRLSFNVSIIRNESLLLPSDVRRAMVDTYNYFVSNGKIEP
jgi:hypothetical protein